MNGDYLLFLNNLVLTVFFLPTLLSRKHTASLLTAAVYAVMIAVGAVGYAINGQWMPFTPMSASVALWAAMGVKSWRLHR